MTRRRGTIPSVPARRTAPTGPGPARLLSVLAPVGLMVGLTAGLTLLSGCAAGDACPERDLPGLGEKVPSLELARADGTPIAIESLIDGKVALVDVWATWCQPCLLALPRLGDLNEKYRDRGFTVVGILVDVNASNIGPDFVSKRGIPYPVLYDDDGERFGCEWGYIPGVPTLLLIDRDGTVLDVHVGISDLDAVEERLAQLLGPQSSESAELATR
ncbi:MAG: TlpA family protein disulfide reductase [Acidobacteriota bacterium]|nr:MAG: TlpA family protein disulfide reductase [Acidobacteriota bacterium]